MVSVTKSYVCLMNQPPSTCRTASSFRMNNTDSIINGNKLDLVGSNLTHSKRLEVGDL